MVWDYLANYWRLLKDDVVHRTGRVYANDQRVAFHVA
jgi:hypothetical protein